MMNAFDTSARELKFGVGGELADNLTVKEEAWFD